MRRGARGSNTGIFPSYPSHPTFCSKSKTNPQVGQLALIYWKRQLSWSQPDHMRPILPLRTLYVSWRKPLHFLSLSGDITSACLLMQSVELRDTVHIKCWHKQVLRTGFLPSVQLRWVHSLRPHGPRYARLPCPSPTPRACSNSCPLRQ